MTKRVDIRTPVRGVVVKLNYHTSGGVVAPGATILELLPVNDELIIESRAMPSDIVHVEEGQKAEVRLSALSKGALTILPGRAVSLNLANLSVSAPEQVPIPATVSSMSIVGMAITHALVLRKAAKE